MPVRLRLHAVIPASSVRVHQLFVFPVKSLRGIEVPAATVTDRGFEHDRRWMVVDEAGVFCTQRELPRMALVSVEIRSDGLVLRAPGAEPLIVSHAPRGERRQVSVWDDSVSAVSAGADARAWLTAFLGVPSELVHMPDDSVRPVDPAYAAGPVSFADGFPYLFTSTASLDDLNARLPAPLSMRRFRPNVVVTGCAPFAEDTWSEACVGAVRFSLVKPCARCVIPTVDPDTAERTLEPLTTLARYRRGEAGVLFGMNAVAAGAGVVRVGDSIATSSSKRA